MIFTGTAPALRRSPALRAGARVALVAPAGPLASEKIDAALANCERFGFEPALGPSAHRRHHFLAGTDAERLADLRNAFEDPKVDAVWALRGGYGTMRLLPLLDPLPRPKPYIGFSDNTALHIWLLHAGCISFHGPHASAEFTPMAEQCFRQVLFEATSDLTLPASAATPVECLVSGRAEGRLIGGNLALLAALCGTPWQPDAHGRILFIEDVGEPPYRVDRLLRQLELAGSIDGIAGIAIGQFTELESAEDEADVRHVLTEFATRWGVPAVSGLPFGHVPENWTLPVGGLARLDADAGTITLLEPAVEAV